MEIVKLIIEALVAVFTLSTAIASWFAVREMRETRLSEIRPRLKLIKQEYIENNDHIKLDLINAGGGLLHELKSNIENGSFSRNSLYPSDNFIYEFSGRGLLYELEKLSNPNPFRLEFSYCDDYGRKFISYTDVYSEKVPRHGTVTMKIGPIDPDLKQIRLKSKVKYNNL